MPTNSGGGLGAGCNRLSIMVPTYNCAAYLREALESLKAQGDFIARAQIEVVDDCSTKDDPEAVVREVWPGRVTFWRHPKNGGLVNTFNTCIARARGEWVHILRGDDFALPGAYREFDACTEEHPEALSVFARVVIVDHASVWKSFSDPLGPGRRGVLRYMADMWAGCPVQFAGVLVSKEAIGKVGGFDDRFCHCTDWNLWWRVARSAPVAYSNTCVGAYRIFEGDQTSALKRTARNLAEQFEQVKLVAAAEAAAGDGRIGADGSVDRLYRPLFGMIASQCGHYLDDPEAFEANFKLFQLIPPSVRDGNVIAELSLRRRRRQLLPRRKS